MAFGCGFSLPSFYGAASGLGMFASASLFLDMTNGNNMLDPRITFTRASSATRTNSAGLIESVSTDQPRFDYDPVTLQPKGLLIEEQRTNLLTYSEQFDNAAWSAPSNNCTVTPNTYIAPDGTLTADTLTNQDGAGPYRSKRTTAITADSNTYCGSIFVRKDTAATHSAYIIVDVESQSNIGTAFILNLSTGVVTRTAGAGSVGVIDCGSYWRVWGTVTNNGLNTTAAIQVYVSQTALSGAATTVWGAQLEAGAFPTSYIPTTSAQVTRAADVASMTGSNFSSWYNQSEGTLFAEADTYATTYNCGIVSSNDGTSSNRLQIFGETNSTVSWYATSGGVNSMWVSAGTRVANTPFKIAGGYALNNCAASLNGSAVVSDASVTIPSVSRLNIGAQYSGLAPINGHIARLAYFPKRLSNTELQGITA